MLQAPSSRFSHAWEYCDKNTNTLDPGGREERRQKWEEESRKGANIATKNEGDREVSSKQALTVLIPLLTNLSASVSGSRSDYLVRVQTAFSH